ncbi:MAG: class I SAM-dependent methyltransferase [Bdellovibrionales bacterium]|nr:class I SAM-dependent methyltransferase [Bdellovibrionales bacterium]
MSTAFNHYKNFLSKIYSWSSGDKSELFHKNAAWLMQQGITEGTLLDLGAGFGSHAIPAAEIGLKVTAVDFSSELLVELKSFDTDSKIKIVESDFVTFLRHHSEAYDYVLCLGDTLTHLDSIEIVKDLIQSLVDQVSENGKLILSWRDYQTTALTNENRFILVRQDEKSLMTCVLEDKNNLQITVTDLYHQKINGEFKVSGHSYPKIKLTPQTVSDLLHQADFDVIKTTVTGRLIEMVATKN